MFEVCFSYAAENAVVTYCAFWFCTIERCEHFLFNKILRSISAKYLTYLLCAMKCSAGVIVGCIKRRWEKHFSIIMWTLFGNPSKKFLSSRWPKRETFVANMSIFFNKNTSLQFGSIHTRIMELAIFYISFWRYFRGS